MVGKPRDVVTDEWRGHPLGQYLSWSTFHRRHRKGGGPVQCLRGKGRRNVRRLLGLDPEDDGVLLLFEYSLPDGISPRFPTVAEAYAGSKWNHWFRPSPLDEPYGLTLPWGGRGGGRPEAVHEVPLADHLTSPILEEP